MKAMKMNSENSKEETKVVDREIIEIEIGKDKEKDKEIMTEIEGIEKIEIEIEDQDLKIETEKTNVKKTVEIDHNQEIHLYKENL
jgi:hypothetical protein